MSITYNFHFQSPRDVFEKLKRDAALLEAEVNGDTVFNFVITAYHLIDWITKAPTQGSAVQKKDVDTLRNNPYLRMCRDLCNGSKHVSIDSTSRPYRNHPPVVDATVVEPNRGFRLGISTLGGGHTLGGPRETISLHVGTVVYDLRDVTREVVDLYEAFFAQHGL